jgi:hypothetical protein
VTMRLTTKDGARALMCVTHNHCAPPLPHIRAQPRKLYTGEVIILSLLLLSSRSPRRRGELLQEPGASQQRQEKIQSNMEDAVFKASFEQVPLNVQSDRIARGRHSLEVCLGFFNDRATVQDRITQQNYRGVEKARGGDAEMKGSSVRRGIEITMGTWSATAGENSGTLALNLRKKVCEPLEQVLASQRENNVRIRARWQQVSRRVKNCEDQLASAKVRLSKSQADRRKAAEAHLLAQTEGKSGLEKLEGR